jgi:hypothetical protein
LILFHPEIIMEKAFYPKSGVGESAEDEEGGKWLNTCRCGTISLGWKFCVIHNLWFYIWLS